MYPSASTPLRHAQARLPLILTHWSSKPVHRVPPRVFGHLLVVVVCLAVAYAGRTTRLSDRPNPWPDGSATLQPSAFTISSPAPVDALSPVLDLAPPAGAAPPRVQIVHYQTLPGDPLSALADRFSISENTIRWTNNLPANADPAPGQQLVILPVSGVLYSVQPGDTVDTIAQRFQSDSASILQVNHLAAGGTLSPGAQVIIPGGRPLEDIARTALSSVSSMPPSDQARAGASEPQALGPATPVPTADVVQPDSFFRIPYVDRFLPHPAPTTPKALAPISYTVSQGDTLSSIAKRYGVSPESIAYSSGIQDTADNLAINQKLTIPPVPGVVHAVQDGDTLDSVAQRYSADPAAIARANGLRDPFVLQVGQTLVVPGGKVAAPPTPTTTYTVQEGDSLAAIADSFGIDVHSMINANGLADPYILQPGQQLTIPGVSTQPATTIASTTSSVAASATDASTVQVAAVSRPAESSVSRPVAAAPRPVAATPRPVAIARAPAPVSSGGWGIVGLASKYLGTPYVWGGTTPGGFDCSGFVYYVYRVAGVPIPRDMWGQLQSGAHVSMSNLQPGDIVFFAGTYEAGLSHEGIYIGGGRFIHAADYGIGVTVSSLYNSYYAAHYYSAARPW